MKYGELRLRNFRCFDWNEPAVIEFRDGFTALIGPNNSGKSAVLRAIFELRPLFQVLPTLFSGRLDVPRHVALAADGDPASLANSNSRSRFQVTLQSPVTPSANRVPYATEITIEYDTGSQALSIVEILATDDLDNRYKISSSSVRNLSPTGQGHILSHTPGDPKYVDISALFRFSESLSSSKYFPAVRNAINEGAGKHYDCYIGTSFIQNWDSWKAGGLKDRQTAINKVEREIESLLGIGRLEVNADQTNKTFDIFIDDHPHKLHEVGSGLSQLILILASALIEKPDFICIDEPELSLHPALQTRFLSTLGSYARRGVIFATHSMGLARSVAQRIYSVNRIGQGRSEIRVFGQQHRNLAEWLGELGYAAMENIGVDRILLVEGQSEVLCFHEFLRKIGKDNSYVVIPLGGSSLINGNAAIALEELKRLVPATNIVGFIDSERSNENEQLTEDRRSFLAICAELKIEMRASERRATENYFPSAAIRLALNDDGYVELGPFGKLKDAQKRWGKSNNWRIVREMNLNDILGTDLHDFLFSL